LYVSKEVMVKKKETEIPGFMSEPISQPEFGVIDKNGIYKNSVRLLDLMNVEDIAFYETIANTPSKYNFTKSDIIVHPNGKIYMLVYYMEMIKELKSLSTKYSDAEASAKTIAPMVETPGSLIDIMSSPIRRAQ
jgi:hypothetical protein